MKKPMQHKENYIDSTEEVIDVLRELGNIGSGNAASSLEDWLGEPVSISLTDALLLTVEDIARYIMNACGSDLGVHACVTGGLQGQILYLLTHEEGKNILDIIMGGEGEGSGLTDCERSALSETGNILFGSYLSALHEMLDVEIDISPPQCSDDLEGVMGEGLPAGRDRRRPRAVLIETILKSERSLRGSKIVFFTGFEAAPRIAGLAAAR